MKDFQLTSYLFIQSEKSKKAGNAPSTTLLIDFLKASYTGGSEVLLLEEDMNFNLRAASLSVSYSILCCILVNSSMDRYEISVSHK